MSKHLRRLLKVLAIIVCVVAVMLAGLEFALNSDFLSSKVKGIIENSIDAKLDFSDIDISCVRSFPRVRVTVDSASLTYPHSLFAGYDACEDFGGLYQAGRGESVDTLARIGHFTASVNILKILGGRLRLSDASASGVTLFAHKYDSTSANWKLLTKDTPEDTTKTPEDLPWISVGELVLDGDPTLYYTSAGDAVEARLSFRRFILKGAAKLEFDSGDFKVRGLDMSMDSLVLACSLPEDSINASIDLLSLKSRGRNVFDTRLEAYARAGIGGIGTFDVPVSLAGPLSCDNKKGMMTLSTEGFGGSLAYIPVFLDGSACFCHDGTQVDMNMKVEDCDLAVVLDKYVSLLARSVSDISTDAHLFLDVDAKGTFTGSEIPALGVKLRIPEAGLEYIPKEFSTRCAAELSASVSPKKRLDAVVHTLNLTGDALTMKLTGDVSDVLGAWKANADVDASAELSALNGFLPDSLDINAVGKLLLNAQASLIENELKTLKFKNSSLSGVIYSDCIGVDMPTDTLSAVVYSPEIRLGVKDKNIEATVNMDSINVEKGDLSAKIRTMRNSLLCYGVESRGKTVPHLDFNSSGRIVSVRTEATRIRLRNVDVQTSFQRRDLTGASGRPRRDSVRRRHVVSESDLDDNIDISIDSSVTKKIRSWSPSGKISIGGGTAVTPSLPLRTRLTDFRGEFSERRVSIDTVAVRLGSSDFGLEGDVKGLMGMLSGRGVLSADMKVNSERVNVNELLVAFTKGRKIDAREALDSEREDFVVDSIPDADIMTAEMTVVKIPGNIDFRLGLQADRVDYSDLNITPFVAEVALKDRVARITDVSMRSDIGNISLEAYYAAKNRNDVSFGADVHLSNVSSKEIIHMMPNVDSFMPALRHFEGKLSADLSVSSKLDPQMNVIWPSFESILRIKGRDLMISDAGNLRNITTLLMFKNKDIGHIDDMSVDAVIHNGELEIFPFKLGVDRYRCILAGVQNMDQQLNYHISVIQSPFIIPFGINIYGFTDNWKYSLGIARYHNGNMPVYTEQLDAIQFNLVESIRNIYNIGVEEARGNALLGGRFMREMSGYNNRKASAEASRTEDEALIDSLAFELAMNDEEMQQEIDAAVDAAMESCRSDFDALIAGYHEKSENKGILRKLKRLEKERKAKKE